MIDLKSFSNSYGLNSGNLLILTLRRANWSFSFPMERCVFSLLDPVSFQQHQQRQIFSPIPRFGNSDQFLQNLAHTQKSTIVGKNPRPILGVRNRLLQSCNPNRQNFVQSRSPGGYFWHSNSRAYFQFRLSRRFCLRIPNPEHQIREIRDPEKPIGDPHLAIYLYCSLRIKFLPFLTS